MPNLNPTVFIVDQDASLRSSLATAIRRAGYSAETFGSADAFHSHSRRLIPSCLLLDVSPDLDSPELLRRIATDREETPVIAMSADADIPMTVRVMKAGAVEFLTKPLAQEVLLAAVGRALTRSRAVLEQAAEQLELRKRYITLSSREREVMRRVVAGFLNKQVGAALGISEITVKAHRGRAMRKMGADSLAELVAMALSLRLPFEPTAKMPCITWAPRKFLQQAGALSA
jgi:FixJ family two-component response regulator